MMPRSRQDLAPPYLLAAVYLGIPGAFYAAIFLIYRALT
jgi:hypothetical protein